MKIKNLIKIIHYLTNSQSSLKIGALKYRPNEIWKMQANNKFAKNVLGWKPRVDFKDGLKITINWYKNFLRMYNKDSLFIKIQ